MKHSASCHSDYWGDGELAPTSVVATLWSALAYTLCYFLVAGGFGLIVIVAHTVSYGANVFLAL